MIKILNKGEAPAEHPSELVGRFVGKDGVMQFRGYGRPMLVTGYSGSRLYLKVGVIDSKTLDEGATMRPTDEWDEEVYMQLSSVAYVCDTIDECTAMVRAGRRSMKIWQDGERRIKAECDQVFEDLVAEQAAHPSL